MNYVRYINTINKVNSVSCAVNLIPRDPQHGTKTGRQDPRR